jgi:hypothetical protein
LNCLLRIKKEEKRRHKIIKKLKDAKRFADVVFLLSIRKLLETKKKEKRKIYFSEIPSDSRVSLWSNVWYGRRTI